MPSYFQGWLLLSKLTVWVSSCSKSSFSSPVPVVLRGEVSMNTTDLPTSDDQRKGGRHHVIATIN